MSKFRIIHNKLEHLPIPLRRKLIKYSYRQGWMKGMFNKESVDQERAEQINVFIKMMDSKVMGFLTCHYTDINFEDGKGIKNCNEYNVFVLKKYRGKGVASELIEYAKVKMPRKKTICFPRDRAGIKLYKKHRLNIYERETYSEINPLI